MLQRKKLCPSAQRKRNLIETHELQIFFLNSTHLNGLPRRNSPHSNVDVELHWFLKISESISHFNGKANGEQLGKRSNFNIIQADFS